MMRTCNFCYTLLYCSKFDFSTLPPEDDEDYVDMGGAILSFYSSLVDLLGRCAPDAESIKAGRSDALRARAILRSLVSMEDLEGVLGLTFILPVGQEGAEGMTVNYMYDHNCLLISGHSIFCILNQPVIESYVSKNINNVLLKYIFE